MNETAFSAFAGLAVAQVMFYRISLRKDAKQIWFIWFFYFSLFILVKVVHLFCAYFSILFYQLPLFSAVLFLIAARESNWLPRFRKAIGGIPNFYILTGLWASTIWFSVFPQRDLLDGLGWSFLAAGILILAAGIKERLELFKPPAWFSGLPVFLLAIGLILFGWFGFSGFTGW
jgi:hypothetical protein